MDLDAVELVNVEARRNRQLAVQDSLQARAPARALCLIKEGLLHPTRQPSTRSLLA